MDYMERMGYATAIKMFWLNTWKYESYNEVLNKLIEFTQNSKNLECYEDYNNGFIQAISDIKEWYF